MRTACGQPCSTIAQLALPVALPYSSPSHRCIRGLMPHHSCFNCASSGEGRAPAAGTNHAPSENRQAPAVGRGTFSVQNAEFFGSLGEGWAPAVSAHAPLKLRPWTRVLFCLELRVLRLIPTGVQTRIPTGVEIRTNFRSGQQRFLHAAHARCLYQPSCGQQ